MSPSKNDITGDFILTGAASEKYRSGWDLIFGKKDKIVNSYIVEIHDKEKNTITYAEFNEENAARNFAVNKANSVNTKMSYKQLGSMQILELNKNKGIIFNSLQDLTRKM